MSFTEQFAYTAGQTDLYAYPASASYALSSTPWGLHRVLATEVVAGFYSATMDEAKSTVWSVFDGSAVPTSHDDAIATIRYEAPLVTTGTGARTVTITVTRSSVAAQGATVRLVKSDGSENVFGTTNSSGVVTFNVTDGTYSVAITHAASSFSGASLTVDGNETATYALTPLSISPPSIPGTATGYAQCISAIGAADPNADCFIKLVRGPGSTGYVYSNPESRYRSNSSGLIEFPGLIHGATYRAWKASNPSGYKEFTVTVGDTYQIPEIY